MWDKRRLQKLVVALGALCVICALPALAKIQDLDLKSAAELINTGGTASELPNDSKIWSSVLGEQLSTALAVGDILTATSVVSFNKVKTATANAVVVTDATGFLTVQNPLSVSHGGTGQATTTAAFAALSPLTVKGDLIGYTGAANVRIGPCADGQQLQYDSTQTSGFKCVAPASFSAGNLTGDATISVTGGANAVNGAGTSLTLGTVPRVSIAAGTPLWVLTNDNTGLVSQQAFLSVSQGGTGLQTFTVNGVLLGNGTQALQTTAVGSANQVLRVPGAGGTPAFGAVALNQAAAVSSQLGLANGGTASDLSATGGASQVLRQNSVGAALTVSQLACANLSDSAASCATDATNASNLSSGTVPKAQLANAVTSITKSGSTALTGDVTLFAGSNITLTQSTQAITIAASAGGVSATTGYEPEVFILNGGASVLSDFDGVRRAEQAKTIQKLVLCLYNSGTSGSTSVSLNFGPSLQYNTGVTLTATSGTACTSVSPAISINTNDLMNADVTGVANGAPEDISLKVLF